MTTTAGDASPHGSEHLYTANERCERPRHPLGTTPRSSRSSAPTKDTLAASGRKSGARSGVGRVNPVAYLSDDTRYLLWLAQWANRADCQHCRGFAPGGGGVRVRHRSKHVP